MFGNEVLASFNTSLALIDLHLLHETTLRFFGIMNVAVAKYLDFSFGGLPENTVAYDIALF